MFNAVGCAIMLLEKGEWRMAKEHYELLALFMRYWFVFLIVMIAWRATRQMLKERHQHNRILRSLPDAGLVGEIVDIKTSEAYPLPREGFISCKPSADIRLKNLDKRFELHFEFIDSKGIQLSPLGRRSSALLDGVSVKNNPYALHGTYLEIGGYVLRFRLFEGLKVPKRTPKTKENIQDYIPSFENTWTFAVEPPQYEADVQYNMQDDDKYTDNYLIQDTQRETQENYEDSPYEHEERFDDGSYFKPANYAYNVNNTNEINENEYFSHEQRSKEQEEQNNG